MNERIMRMLWIKVSASCMNANVTDHVCCLSLTLHLHEFGHVGAVERVDPLRLSVSIHVQLDVGRKSSEQHNTDMMTSQGQTEEVFPSMFPAFFFKLKYAYYAVLKVAQFVLDFPTTCI